MEAKPILSTSVMQYGGGDYETPSSHVGLCGPDLHRVFRLRKSRPQAIRLHAFARPAKGRRLIRLRRTAQDRFGAVPYCNMEWTTSATRWPEVPFLPDFGDWLLRRAPFAADLRAGKTVTVHVALEVVEGCK